jgi:hypothetical protein
LEGRGNEVQIYLNARKIHHPGRSLGPLGMSKCLNLKAPGWVCVSRVWMWMVWVQIEGYWCGRQACEDGWGQDVCFGDEPKYECLLLKSSTINCSQFWSRVATYPILIFQHWTAQLFVCPHWGIVREIRVVVVQLLNNVQFLPSGIENRPIKLALNLAMGLNISEMFASGFALVQHN